MPKLTSKPDRTNFFPGSGITRRLLWFSSFMILSITIIAATCASYCSYQAEWAALEKILSDIKHAQIPEIKENVCNKNIALLSGQAQEIKKIPHIIHVTISDGQKELASAGKIEGLNPTITRQYPISCFAADEKIITGMLTVTASTDYITSDTAAFFLFACMKIATLLLALAAALLFYMQHRFIHPLEVISVYIRELTPDLPQQPLVHNHRLTSSPDEIDALAALINRLRKKTLDHITGMRQYEDSLRSNEALLQELLESASEPVFWKDTQGAYLGCSRRFARLAGLDSPGCVIGKTDAALPLFAGSAQAIMALQNTVYTKNRPATALLQLEGTEAQPLWIFLQLEPVRDANGACRAVIGSCRDVTDQHNTEGALERCRLQQQSIFELPAMGMAILSASKFFLKANQRLSLILGYTEKELQQKNFIEFIHPDELPHTIEQFDRLLAGTKNIFSMESRFIRKNGEAAQAEVAVSCLRNSQGTPDQYSVVFTDTTERRAAEMRLHMLTAAVNQIQEIVIITDTRAVILYVNPAFTRATGYSSLQAIGKTPALLHSGKQDDNFYKTLWATISQGDIWRGRFINKKHNGELYDEEATIYPIRSDAGTITNFLAVKRDITHDLKIEHQLRQVQKMEAIGTLAGGIAHDFNNILGVIYGYAEMSMDHEETLPQIRSNLQEVVSATNRAKDLIRQILTISRQTEKEAMPVTIVPIVKEVLKFIRASLPSSIRIKQSLEVKNDLLLADPIQIHQLLMNLCTNAGHAMKDISGVMEISLKNIHFNDTDIQEYPLMRSGDYICLSVKDTGSGISPENIEHIFEPYFTTKESSEGTGLGLAVVHGIVRNCGGDIRVYSEVGKGSVFNVYLPLISRKTEKLNEPALEIPTGTEHIMFVDDEISLVKTSKIILERLAYTVTGITSSDEALATFKNTPDAFDLVITDKTMPELTGFDLVRAIKTLRPDLPIILCTGVSAKTDLEKVHEMGINGIILKPFNKRELAGIIRDVLDKKNVLKG